MKEENHLPFFIGSLIAITVIVIAMFVAQKQQSGTLMATELHNQQQIEQVATAQDEQIFETKNDKEIKQLLTEIQKHGKKIINFETQGKVMRVTYSN